MNLIESITHNPVFPIATFVVGILVRTYFYYKSKKQKVLRYVLKSYNLLADHTSKFSDLSIKYKNEDVKNFTVTKLIFWNSGKETIDGKDITNAEPLKIKIKEGFRILDVSLIKSNNIASQISVSQIYDNSHIVLSFDYLDFQDGGVLNIIHDGVTSEDIDFKGKIKGIRKIIKTSIPKAPDSVHFFIPIPIHKDVSKHNPNKRRFYYGLSQTIMGITFAGFVFLMKLLQELFPNSKFINNGGKIDNTMIYFMCILSGFIIAFGIYTMCRRLPKDLDIYEDI
jgi:hypothetical protein